MHRIKMNVMISTRLKYQALTEFFTSEKRYWFCKLWTMKDTERCMRNLKDELWSAPPLHYITRVLSVHWFSNPALALLQEASLFTVSAIASPFSLSDSRAKQRKGNGTFDRSNEFQLHQPLNTQHGSCRTCQSLKEMERGETWKCPFSFRLRMIATKWSLPQSDSQSVYLSVSQSISLSFCLSVRISVNMAVCLNVFQSLFHDICLSACMFNYVPEFTKLYESGWYEPF